MRMQLLFLISLLGSGLLGSNPRIIRETLDATDLKAVSLRAGVGEIELRTHDHGEIILTVEVSPKGRRWFFGSRQTLDLARVELVREQDSGRLSLRVQHPEAKNGDEFRESWHLTLPRPLAVTLELGVGDIEVMGLSSGFEVQLGVGDLDAVVDSGEVVIDLGVGDISLQVSGAAYQSIKSEVGVGDTELRNAQKVHKEGHIVGNSLTWQGPGDFGVVVEVGVGDAEIVLF